MRAFILALPLVLSACAPVTAVTQPFPDTVARLPLGADPQRVRVVVMGDQGTGSQTQAQVAAAMREVCAREGCDLGVALGDNFYPAGPKDVQSPLFKERFADLYGPLKVPFLMVSGNHDESWLAGGDGADARGGEVQVAYSRLNPQWVMPARTYRAPVGRLVEFFTVATSPLAAYLAPRRATERPGGSWDTAQRAWLQGALGRSPARWKLVLGHHPLFSNSNHGDAGRYDNAAAPLQRGEAVRRLYGVACGKADLLLSGHDHALELFAPQPGCAGTWTLVSGAAGRASSPRVGRRPAAFEAYEQPGFMWLDVQPTALSLRVYTVDAAGHARLAHTQTLNPGP
ncbi:metallophosphoesterase [Deinococcus koreensis]|uniref:Acid phosphatase n=1 Tax=Deinococcus koreensis TaxID=2054903 RepID=A0A2K3V2I1_9DEIO|nr:metallophosphoesterase [Deinococcus koreensis]PNY82999.1 acid phosphatase [Deinococcus koreensis]